MAEAKQLRIKAGSVSRLHREISIYNEEVATQQAVVDRLKQQSGDSHDIKHAVRGLVVATGHARSRLNSRALQENVLQESRMMIPDTQSRLEAAVAELQKLLVRNDLQGCSEDRACVVLTGHAVYRRMHHPLCVAAKSMARLRLQSARHKGHREQWRHDFGAYVSTAVR